MKLLYCLPAAIVFDFATASFKNPVPIGHEWIPAKHSDSRSPCPGLNVMANHGWLPRSGKDIDLAAIQHATSHAFNYAPDTFNSAFQMVQDFHLSTTGNFSTFNLQDVEKHDAIEFDGSLSRNDHYFGDNLHFDPAIWRTVAQDLDLYHVPLFGKGRFVTLDAAAKAWAARVKEAKSVNPVFNSSALEIMGSPGTTALYLTTLWDYDVGAASKAWIRAFFEDERIPYLEGFRRPVMQKTNEELGARTKAVIDAAK